MSTTTSRSADGNLWTSAGWKEGLRTEAVTSSTGDIKSRYDAIVVGAGFAGLIAARDLTRNSDLRVLLIEARDRIGGRTWTAKELGEEIEMGGTWIHWSQPHVYSELVNYGLHHNIKPTVACMKPAQDFHNFGTRAEDMDPDQVIKLVDGVAQKFLTIDGLTSRDLMPYPHDPYKGSARWRQYDYLSVDQRLKQIDIPKRDKEMFEAYISLFGCSKPGDFAFTEVLRWYALAGHSMANVFEQTSVYKMGNGGMTSVAKAILNDTRADRLFGTQITRIEQNSFGVEVFTAPGKKISAKAVILTIPVNCLNDVKFSPPLSPLRQEAADLGQLNKGAKLHFRLREKDPLWFGTSSVNSPAPYLLAFADHNGTKEAPDGTYVVAAAKSGGINDIKNHDQMLKDFLKTFREGATVDAYLFHDWTNDQYSKGQWSCWGPSGMSRYLRELQKPHGRVLFASADWADGWRGFIDGAMESGKRAAQEVAKICKGGSQVQANL